MITTTAENDTITTTPPLPPEEHLNNNNNNNNNSIESSSSSSSTTAATLSSSPNIRSRNSVNNTSSLSSSSSSPSSSSIPQSPHPPPPIQNRPTNPNNPYFDNNLNEIVTSLKRMMVVDVNSFAVTFTLIIALVIVGFINFTSNSLLWMCAMIALFVTLFQIWYALRENRLLFSPTSHLVYPGQHSIWGVNRYYNHRDNNGNNHNGNNNNNNNHGFIQPLNNRFPHLINAPLNLQLTLIDRDFNSNDYEMLLALDHDNYNYGAAKKEQIESLPMHKITSDEDIKSLFPSTNTPITTTSDSTTTTTTTNNNNNNNGNNDDSLSSCSICLESFQVDDHLKTLPCLHHFHCHCIDKWLKIKANCPICKSSLTFR